MQIKAVIEYSRGNQIGVGQGMNSKVFLADDPQLGGRFVAKEIEKAGLRNSEYFIEAQAMFAVEHPNIVAIQYACQDNNNIVLTMPHYPKGSLHSRISAAPLELRELIRISQGLLQGLAAIHGAGFVHFDLKPSNILFDDIDTPLIADFGQARTILPNGSVAVPPLYPGGIPPEAYLSSTGGYYSDIYQMGLLLYRAVNGDMIYQEQLAGLDDATLRQRIISGKFPDRNIFLPHVPRRVRTIIRKALQLDPLRRYSSAPELAATLGRVRCGLNWRMIGGPGGELLWRAERVGKADLEVELKKSGLMWDVRVYSVANGTRRAKDPTNNQRLSLARSQAMKHLTEVFRRLV